VQWKIPKLSTFTKYVDAQKFGDKKLCVITGTSSGLGKQTTKHLLRDGGWHVICAVRDVDKMNLVAEEEQFDPKSFTVMKCDLGSFQSVRDFVKNLNEFKADRPLDRLVCNAAVYQPSLPYAKYSEDGIEQQLQTNFLSHFLLCSLLVSAVRYRALPCTHAAFGTVHRCAVMASETDP
jgi:NAD(P)-dependent dehydrogenase (short-subunit alcohol dehydrogenase family)